MCMRQATWQWYGGAENKESMSSESGSEDDWEDVEPLRADDGKSLGYRLHKHNRLPGLEVTHLWFNVTKQ